MQTIAYTPTTELDAVNLILRTIGESPISSLENSGNVDAVTARQTLHSTSRRVQAMGWHWNTRVNYTLAREVSTNEITVPLNCLKVDSTGPDAARDVVQRGTRLFDRANNTYAWDKGLTVEMVELLPFEELPEAARSFVALSAARIFQEDQVGSATLSKMDRTDEQRAWADLLNAEAETADYNVLTGNYSVARVLAR